MNLVNICAVLFLLFFSSINVIQAAKVLSSEPNGKTVLQLEDDEIAIFGYGSLMLEEQLHEPHYNGPFIQAELDGFKRSWSVRYPNRRDIEIEDPEGELFKPKSITYLNIEPCTDCKVNGMIFISSADYLESYDDRESSYDRIKINDDLLNISVIGGNSYAYTAKPSHYYPTSETTSPKDTVILGYYVDIIEDALEAQGEEFATEYDNSSQPVPKQIVF
ncbi:MAG: hypothetical protein C5B43_03440 [Verrucomicrobia bacterium]|nr:MAG: hypothetical protein C5B43_03440 [Verrucomicrobiota bacterium]